MKELEPNISIEKTQFTFSRHFGGMSHNYVCAVCKENSAVQDCSVGILQPCWNCQFEKGYFLVKFNWFSKLLFKIGWIK